MIENILERLDGVRKSGKGYIAKCSAHQDKNPSLSLMELSDGRILINCHAGCIPTDVLAAIGLSLSDLFPDGGLGDFKSFQRINEDIKGRKNDGFKLSIDEITLKIAEFDREAGKRLSASDLKKEREAYERVKNANIRG